MRIVALAFLAIFATPPAEASTYVLVVGGYVISPAYTPLSGNTIKTDFPPDMPWIDVSALSTPPVIGSGYAGGVFTAPIAPVVSAPVPLPDPLLTATISGAIMTTKTVSGVVATQALPIYTDTQAKAAVSPLIPVALSTIPLPPTSAGTAGSGLTYIPGNAATLTLSRSSTVTTASDGTFSVTWAVPLVSSTPPVNTIPINTGTQPVICNVTSRSASAVAGKCWMLSATILTSAIVTAGTVVNPSGGSASGISVMVVAREPSQ